VNDDFELGASASAPPVVAVTVVHEPGEWFAEMLQSLAAQDHPNLQYLFVLTASSGAAADAIAENLPGASVRTIPGNPGFGAAANEVLRLVEGDQGFFCFLHDDVALAPNAISLLVAELYRSNAGVLGPKLLEWDAPGRIESVGLRADRFGHLVGIAERGEPDQEQHDAVRDVFCISTACMLVRADLFRTLGGFDATIEHEGDGLDLCWRAHLSGARVMVVPDATVRHRARIAQRRDDSIGSRLAARHGLITALVMSGRLRSVVTAVVAPFVALLALVGGLFVGSTRGGLDSLRASASAFGRLGWIAARRRRVQPLRAVPDSEIRPLLARGSLQLGALIRHRQDTEEVRDRTRVARRALRTSGRIAVVVWVAVVVWFVVGSRSILGGRVPTIGSFLPIPSSAMDLFRTYASGWWPSGLGRSEAAPTAVGLLGLANMVSLGNPGLLRTLLVLGPVVVGFVGIFHFAAVFRSGRGRAAALVAYAVNPLPYSCIAAGRWAPLAVYGAFPWALELLRRSSGLQGASGVVDDDGREVTDAIAVVGIGRQVRLIAALALLEAVVAAFVPSFPLLVLLAAVVLALATVGVRGTVSTLAAVASAAIAALVAFALHLPWSLRFLDRDGWTEFVGGEGGSALGLARLARFEVGQVPIAFLSIALFVPLVVGVLIAKGWRLTWMARAGALVLVFAGLAIASDSGSTLPEVGVLLVPVVAALAVSAAVAVCAFDEDVRGGRIGWRQPVALLAFAALAVSVVPGIAGLGDGRWNAPSPELAGTLGSLPTNPPSGDFRILYLGDARVLPLPGRPYRDGIAYAVSDDGALTVLDSWSPRSGAGDALIVQALDSISRLSTLRGGRLLAPLGIRYIVVPLVDGLRSRRNAPLPSPVGLEDALADQVDLRRSSYVSDQAIVFENTAALPLRALLGGRTEQASRTAGAGALVEADFSEVIPVFVGIPHTRAAREAISGTGPTVLHDAVGKDPRWRLTLDGTRVTGRSAFGWSTAYDLPGGGRAVLRYDTPWSRTVVIVVQLALWIVVVVATSRFRGWRRWLMRRRQRADVPSGPMIRLEPEVRP